MSRAAAALATTERMAGEGEVMAASSGSAGTGDQEKPPFTFEQIVLRVVVAVMLLALLVVSIEFGQVRGRVDRLETEGPSRLHARTTKNASPSHHPGAVAFPPTPKLRDNLLLLAASRMEQGIPGCSAVLG